MRRDLEVIKICKSILLINVAVLFFSTALYAQYTIQGIITDENGIALSGAGDF